MTRNQWKLFEDRDDALVDALFRLRATPNIIVSCPPVFPLPADDKIHESTNSLLSLMCEISEPLFFLTVIQSALSRYLASHAKDEPSKSGINTGLKARASGYLFGLTGIGMCILRMSSEVVRIEAPKLSLWVEEVSLRLLR
jgi:CLIP-associating protein 1/2